MKGIATEKVAGGKLVRIKANFEDSKILSLQITGDFFLHPEEKLKEIEDLFFGKNIFFDEKKAQEEIEKIVEKNGMTLVGINPEAIVKITKQAILNGTEEKIKEEAENQKMLGKK